MTVVLVTAPDAAVKVVSTSDAKTHLRVIGSDEDTYIGALVSAAVAYLDGAAGIMGRALITQTWDYKIDEFPCDMSGGVIELPLAPLQSITSISYVDTAGVTQVLDSSLYSVDQHSVPPRVYPAYGKTWPLTRDQINAVTIRGVYGYGAAASAIPPNIIAAINLLVGHWYQNREAAARTGLAEMPFAVQVLLAPFIIVRF